MLFRQEPEAFGYYGNYLAKPEVRAAIHVGNLTYNSGTQVEIHLINDVMDTVKPWIATLMENYKVSSVCLSVSPSVCLSVSLFVCTCIYLCLYVYLSPSVCLSISLSCILLLNCFLQLHCWTRNNLYRVCLILLVN